MALSIGITVMRLVAGIPMSIDTTSHLYRVLFLQEWIKQGVAPFWSPDWYAGSPALLLYPPLGYYMAIGLSLVGLDPLFSYKIVDAAFYWVAPLAAYFLAKELGFTRGESALGALFFSVVPEVVENYLFYDRFPTVISIPIFCVFLTLFHKALLNKAYWINFLGSTLAMSALLLTHHLSALIAGILAVLLVIFSFGTKGFVKPLVTLGGVAVGTLAMTAFWLVPFIGSVQLFAANEFYNRNVKFPFLQFSYFSYDVVSLLLGIAQFILAAIGMHIILTATFKRKIRINTALFFIILFVGMVLFEQGEALPLLGSAGELLVIASFLAFLGQLLISRGSRRILKRQSGIFLGVVWFLAFLWIGLGYYALPILWVPYVANIWTRTMDVYRIWLYLALPMSALAARGFLRSALKLRARKPALVLLLVGLTITPIAAGVALKTNYAFNSRINQVLPYSTSNAEIPREIVDYFRNDRASGRILGIAVPLWIYVLPNYVGKPIIDGWYPQSKLVTQLVRINDYRLDDLETTGDERRLEDWRSLIRSSPQLDITWVIIGTEAVRDQMMSTLSQAAFSQELVVQYPMVTEQLKGVQLTGPTGVGELFIFKSAKVPAYVDAPAGFIQEVIRPDPDRITLKTSPTATITTVVIKEAYFPTWAAEADGVSISVKREQSTGFISLDVPTQTHEVNVYQRPQSNIWGIISAASLIICLTLLVIAIVKNRRSH